MTQPGPTDHAAVLSRDEMRRIAEIGFVACGSRNAKAAQSIFEGLLVLAPKRSFAYIGLAMSRMCVGDADAAVRILREQGLPANPDEDDIRVIFGIALHDAKQHAESRRVLTAVLAQDKPDSPERKLARALLSPSDDVVSAAVPAVGALPRPATARHTHYI